MTTQANSVYKSCSCNRLPNALDWGHNNFIGFASTNSIIIYDRKALGTRGKVVNTLYSHNAQILSVRFIADSKNSAETYIACSYVDGAAALWKLDETPHKQAFWKAHNGVASHIDGKLLGDICMVATLGSDSQLKIWSAPLESSDLVTLRQQIDFGSSIGVSLRMTFLPESEDVMIAVGMDTSKIGLYCEKLHQTNEFEKCSELIGHQDWVQGLDFCIEGPSGELLLASGSQDTFVRIWKICVKQKSSQGDSMEKVVTWSLESVLAGNEGWIYGVQWSPTSPDLLVSSMDRTITVWRYKSGTDGSTSGSWSDEVRVGEVGGNTLGFYGAKFSPDGRSFVGHSYQGSMHTWTEDQDGSFRPGISPGGHFAEVVDLAWEPEGQFLITASVDQTTRIHAPWITKGEENVSWHEVARPQVHGYDMACLGVVSRYIFASGADEKIIRVFRAPANFVGNFRRICAIGPDPEGDAVLEGPRGASVPSLGLSNKAVYDEEEQSPQPQNGDYPDDSYFKEVELNAPPTEEDLLQNTLWPELRKLYGHGFELYSLAASPNGRFVASASKARTPDAATILIWDSSNWQISQSLSGHTLTVTQLAFSPNSQFLLSVSRDRTWCFFALDASTNAWSRIQPPPSAKSPFSRIIWCCAFSHDSNFFAAGSRDGKLATWGCSDAVLAPGGDGPFDSKGRSITAVCFAPKLLAGGFYLLSVGFEEGSILILKWHPDSGWENLLALDQSFAHHLEVKRLQFRPLSKANNGLELASCGSDGAVQIYQVQVQVLS